MVCILYAWSAHVGFSMFLKLYFVPYVVRLVPHLFAHPDTSQLTNHWIVMLTFLHHSDPTIPHYRSKEWTYVRGALATVDRPFLGWAGRFFLVNVSHDHVGSYALEEGIPADFHVLLRSHTTSLHRSLCLSVSFLAISWECGLTSSCYIDNLPAATECIKSLLQEDYNYDSTVRFFTFICVISNSLFILEHIPRLISELHTMLLHRR